MRRRLGLRCTKFWLLMLCAMPGFSVAAPRSYDAEFLQEARYMEAGPARIYPSVITAVGYDSNIFESADNEVDSTVTRVAPEVSALLPFNAGAVQAGVQADAMRFSESSDDNFTNRSLFGRTNFEAGARNRFNLNAALNKSHDPRGTGLTEGIDPETTTITSPDEYTDKVANFRYEFGAKSATGRIRLMANYLDHDYDNHRERTRYFDRTDTGYGAAFLWRALPRTALVIEARDKHIEYDERRPGDVTLDSRERSALLGAEWDITDKSTGTLRVGHNRKNFDAPERSDGSSVVWEATAKWSPRTYSHIELTVDRAPNETNGEGDFIDTQNYGVKWTHAWRKRFSTDIGLGYKDQSYQRAEREEKTKSAQLGLRYEMRHWLIWRLDAAWRNRDSDIAVLDFERQRYWLTAEFRL